MYNTQTYTLHIKIYIAMKGLLITLLTILVCILL